MKNNNHCELGDAFIQEFLQVILKNMRLPKQRMELVVQTLIQTYLKLYGGDVKFIASEFPMKHVDDFQSDSIDLILYHTRLKTLYLVELKTSETTFNAEQYEKYLEWERDFNQQIQSSPDIWGYMYDRLQVLREKSTHSKKYHELQIQIMNYNSQENEVAEVCLLYIVPEKLISRQLFQASNTKILTFRGIAEKFELPEFVADFLRDIDHLNNSDVKDELHICHMIYQNLITYSFESGKIPHRVQYSTSQNKPNYSVSFIDGSHVNFRLSGRPHTFPDLFNQAKMRQWVSWTDLCTKISMPLVFHNEEEQPALPGYSFSQTSPYSQLM